jgi:NAD-dependent dihydropyrimidine dehydrogenase PreA subunit
MVFAITDACVDVKDRSCMEECPVDCIYEGDRKMYINPVECIDCGACEQVCPTKAAVSITSLAGKPEEWNVQDNAEFFDVPLSGGSTPLGIPGGASHLGRVGIDTRRIAALPPSGPS